MRPAIRLTVLASLCLLGGAVVASAAIAPPPEANAAAPSTDPANEMDASLNISSDADNRASQIAACVADRSIPLPNGTNANLFCACTVDKMRANHVTGSEAILQCAAEMRIASPGFRASEIRQCVEGAGDHLPQGTDQTAFCSCAVDKMMISHTPQRDAISQCAAEMHVSVRNVDEG